MSGDLLLDTVSSKAAADAGLPSLAVALLQSNLQTLTICHRHREMAKAAVEAWRRTIAARRAGRSALEPVSKRRPSPVMQFVSVPHATLSNAMLNTCEHKSLVSVNETGSSASVCTVLTRDMPAQTRRRRTCFWASTTRWRRRPGPWPTAGCVRRHVLVVELTAACPRAEVQSLRDSCLFSRLMSRSIDAAGSL